MIFYACPEPFCVQINSAGSEGKRLFYARGRENLISFNDKGSGAVCRSQSYPELERDCRYNLALISSLSSKGSGAVCRSRELERDCR
jgi:hypothetical protein